MTYVPEPLTSWGRVIRRPQRVARPRYVSDLEGLLRQAKVEDQPLLGIGLGRSYGDSGLNAEGLVIGCQALDRFLAFDPVTGVLRAEAGTSLDDILRLVVPHGWFLPTTPGTRYVTLAGAVANDVHGKNHHRAGSFGCHVRRIGLLRSDAGVLELASDQNPELFSATIGGLGLTGLISWVEIGLVRIPSGFIDQETVPFRDLNEYFALNAESESGFEHVSAWIDCTALGASLGRGVMFRGDWSQEGELAAHAPRQSLAIPVEAPPGLMNGLTLRAFNTAYLTYNRLRRGWARAPYASAFHPLDSIKNWNRLYGPAGFYQHQFVVPSESQQSAIAEVLRIVASSGQGSFLAVLKSLGTADSGGLVSFPRPGASLALDFPNRGASTLALLDRLDRVVTEAGGRIYPAKDGRMAASVFQAGYPRWPELEAARDPKFSSAFWRRVTQ